MWYPSVLHSIWVRANGVWINGMIFIWLHRFGSSRPRWEPVWIILEHAFKFLSNENTGKASRVGVAALPGASVCKHWQERRDQRCWERVTPRGIYTTRESLHSQESKVEKRFEGLWKTRRATRPLWSSENTRLKDLWKHTLLRSCTRVQDFCNRFVFEFFMLNDLPY